MRRELFTSRTAAQQAIAEGRVTVGTIADPKPSTMVAPDDPVDVAGPPERFVGRGGYKLDHALEHFDIPVAGRRAIDVGASTGGFTDCLLQRGAASVVAVDVGYGQLHERLRTDDRITVVDRTNIRHADPNELGAPFDVVAVDLSFIAIHTVAAELAALGASDSDWVVLVKPQFEVGRERVGKRGIVRDPAAQIVAIEQAAVALGEAGVGAVGLTESPITGASGNREFLLQGRHGETALDPGTVRRVVIGEESE